MFRPTRLYGPFTAIIIGMFLVLSAGFAFATPSTEIVINIPAFSLHVYQDGVPTATYPIGVGQVVKPSLLGETKIINRVFYPTYYPPDWYIKGMEPIPPGPDNPVGTRWLGLGFPSYGIHGTNNPASIGTPASSGCIRLYNHHVEELAELVGVGTKVRFVYETIQAWRDPLTGNPLIRVHPDIYDQGTNTVDAALRELARLGVSDDIDRWMLQALINEAAAEPRSVPTRVSLTLDGKPVGAGAVRYGGRLLLPLGPIAEHMGMTVADSVRMDAGEIAVGGHVVPGSFRLGGRAFAPLNAGAAGFGLIGTQTASGTAELTNVRLIDRGARLLPVRTHAMGEWLLLPVQDVAAHLGVDVGWNRDLEAVVIGGRPIFGVFLIENRAYLPHDRLADLLGIRIQWSTKSAVATLQTAEVRMTGGEGSTNLGQGFVYGPDAHVPLRQVTDRLQFTLGWNQSTQTAYVQGIPVQGVVRDGRVFAPIDALREVVPTLDYRWNDEEYDLTLSLGG